MHVTLFKSDRLEQIKMTCVWSKCSAKNVQDIQIFKNVYILKFVSIFVQIYWHDSLSDVCVVCVR